MRIAVAGDGLDVSLHSSGCASYMCYTIVRGIITSCQNTPNPGFIPDLAADYLTKLGVDVFIVHDIDPNARRAFQKRGIEVVEGASGPAREAVDAYLARLFAGDDKTLHSL